MKISMEIDCTPSEARRFFGLPDLEPLQTEMMEVLKARMMKSLDLMDPEALARAWFPVGAQGVDQLQKFMRQIMKGAAGARPDNEFPEKE